MSEEKGHADFKVELDGLESAMKGIKKDINEAAQEATSETASKSLEKGKDHIRRHDRIWNRDVLHNWVPIREKTKYGTHVTGFKNWSDHAAPVDEGATYDTLPNIDNIKQYVRSEYPGIPESDVNSIAYQISKNLYENGFRGIDFTGEMEKRSREVYEPIFKKKLSEKQ